jgi:hypothetical protein
MSETEQAPNSESVAQSIEDRLTAQFDHATPPKQAKAQPETPTESPDGEIPEQPVPEFAEVEYEGETFQVPTKLKEAVIQKADYTRKTQEVAEARRQIELQNESFRMAQAEQEFNQTVSEPTQQLAIIAARTKDLLDNWQSLTTDQKQELLFLDKQRDSIAGTIQVKRKEFEGAQKQALEKLRAQAMESVRKSIPGWSPELAQEITKHAMSDGYTQAELSNIVDPRHVKTLWKAKQFDALQAKAKSTPPPPKIVKPGASNPMPQAVKDKLGFQKQMKVATSSSQKARLIEERLARSFK